MTKNVSNAGRRDLGSAGWLLGLIFVCLAAGIVAAGYFYYRNFEKNYRSAAERQLSAIADLKVSELVQWRKERLADGAIYFKNPSFSALVRRFFEKPADADAQRQLQDWLGRYPEHDSYEQVRLLDAQGVTRLSVPDNLGPASSAIVRGASEVLRSGQVAIQDFYRHDHDRRIYLAILVPILDERDASRPLGVLVLRIDPETYLYPFIKRWPTSSLTAETLLVRREGNEVVFLNDLRFQPNAALNLRAPVDRAALPAAQAALGREGITEGLDYRAVPVVAALRTIPDSPWSLVARVDAAEVYGPMRERLWQIVALIGSLLFGAGAFVGLVWRQQRVRFYRERAETENEASRMVTVVRDSNDAITIQDFEGRITAWNRGAELMYGYSEEEALAANIERLTTPGKVAEQKDFIRRLIAGEKVTSFETQRVTKDGRVLDVWMTVTKLVDEAGKPVGVASTERDITARKREAEEASRMATVVRDSNDAITIQDFEGRITAWNHGAELMYGYGETEALAANIERLTTSGKVAEQKDFIRRLIAGEAITSFETQRVTKDGRILDVWMTVTKLMDEAGKPVGLASTERDITERKRTENAFRESNDYLENLFNYANAPIIVWDPQFRITRFNHAFESLTGRRADEVIGKSLELLFPPASVEGSMALIKKTTAGERWETVEVAIQHRDGPVRTVLWNSATIFAPDGKTPVATIAQGQDITERKRAEEALKTSEERFRTAAENLTDVVYDWDIKEKVDWYGDIDGIMGYPPGGFPRTIKGWAATIHPEDKDRVIAALEGHLKSVAPYVVEYRVGRRDGEWRWWSARGTALRDDRGEPYKMIGSITDITERKQAEETLRESEARYRTLIENIPQKILMKDRSCRWVSINKNLARDFGFRPEEVVGKMDTELFRPELAAKYHADDVRIMETGQTEELEEKYLLEGRETWVNTIKTPVRGANGEITGVLGVFWDITDRKRAEAALRESESRFRQLAESLPQLVWTCQPDGPCDYLNRQWVEFTGVPEAQQHGFGWLEQLHPDDRAPTVATWEAAVASGSDFRVEFRIRRHDGEYRWFDTQAVQLRDAGGHTVKWFGSNTDMTERKQAEEEIRQFNAELEQRVRERTAQLQAANQELEAFSYSVSHDLRAPLRHVQGYVDMLGREAEGRLSDQGRRYMKTITDASREMGVLIDDLLAFARMGRSEMIETKVNLDALVRETLRDLEPATHERNIVWKIPPLPAVQADPAMLKLALANLLGNAVKFTRPRDPAQIEIGCAGMEGERVIVFVRDNGVGFDPQYAHKLFGVFQRLHRADEFEGTGIGLASVRRIIARHGGRTWAEGRLNEGATFFFTLNPMP